MIRASERLRAVSADESVATELRVPVGAPLLLVERTTFTYNDQPAELRRGFYLTDELHYHNELG